MGSNTFVTLEGLNLKWETTKEGSRLSIDNYPLEFSNGFALNIPDDKLVFWIDSLEGRSSSSPYREVLEANTRKGERMICENRVGTNSYGDGIQFRYLVIYKVIDQNENDLFPPNLSRYKFTLSWDDAHRLAEIMSEYQNGSKESEEYLVTVRTIDGHMVSWKPSYNGESFLNFTDRHMPDHISSHLMTIPYDKLGFWKTLFRGISLRRVRSSFMNTLE